jgi:hypothetical protein
MHDVRCNCRKIPNGVNGIEERLHVVWQEMVVPGKLQLAVGSELRYCLNSRASHSRQDRHHADGGSSTDGSQAR